ncbi:MAG: hypothetical protein WB630_08825 [Candidatus Acidiferrales bacterium]
MSLDALTSELMLNHVKLEIQKMDPSLDPESPEFRTAVTVMAATFVVGPDVDLLAQFTGYPMTFVANIACRMRRYELWSDDQVCTGDWLEGDRVNMMFWVHCLVAEGLMRIARNENGERVYATIPGPN